MRSCFLILIISRVAAIFAFVSASFSSARAITFSDVICARARVYIAQTFSARDNSPKKEPRRGGRTGEACFPPVCAGGTCLGRHRTHCAVPCARAKAAARGRASVRACGRAHAGNRTRRTHTP